MGWLSSRKVCLAVRTGFVNLRKTLSGLKSNMSIETHLVDLLLDCFVRPPPVVCVLA